MITVTRMTPPPGLIDGRRTATPPLFNNHRPPRPSTHQDTNSEYVNSHSHKPEHSVNGDNDRHQWNLNLINSELIHSVQKSNLYSQTNQSKSNDAFDDLNKMLLTLRHTNNTTNSANGDGQQHHKPTLLAIPHLNIDFR